MKVKGTNRNYEKKEKIAIGATFAPTGEVIEKGFNAEWGGHRFTDEEIEQLLAGESITITTDKEKEFAGKLAKGEYKGYKYWSFTPDEKEKVAVGATFAPTGEVIEKGFNAEWGGHRFTDSEVDRLLRGEELTVISENGTPIVGILGQKSYKGNKFWGFISGIPNTFCGHNFKAEEKQQMYSGDEVYVDDFWSSKQEKYYAAWVSWDPIENEIVMDFKSVDDEDYDEYDDPDEEFDETEYDEEIDQLTGSDFEG